jgi:hypothetical protein
VDHLSSCHSIAPVAIARDYNIRNPWEFPTAAIDAKLRSGKIGREAGRRRKGLGDSASCPFLPEIDSAKT